MTLWSTSPLVMTQETTYIQRLNFEQALEHSCSHMFLKTFMRFFVANPACFLYV